MTTIDLEQNVIHIHVPKTGGTSFEKTGCIAMPYIRHKTLYDCKKILENDERTLDDFFKFGFVRNPYHRIASGVLNHPMRGQDVANFSHFIKENQNMLHEWVVTKPMHTFLEIDGKMGVDFVGRFENIKNDWAEVCRRLGKDPYLPHANAGRKHPPYDELYDDESRAIIAEHCKRDFEIFGYTP